MGPSMITAASRQWPNFPFPRYSSPMLYPLTKAFLPSMTAIFLWFLLFFLALRRRVEILWNV